MSGATLDRMLAVLLVILLAGGLLTLRAGVPATAPLFWLHGLLGGALLVASAEKLRRSIGPAVRRRRFGRLAVGAVLTLLVAASLAGGFTWVASGRIVSIGPWTILTLHVWAALAAVPFVLVHLLPRRWRLARPRSAMPRVSRRSVLAMGGVMALGAAEWAGANLLDVLRGGSRRFTGSRFLPSGGIPPPTTFYGEGTPAIDADAWRLTVDGRVARTLSLSGSALAELGVEEREATLDCTSGWAMTTTWRGTPLTSVLEAAGAEAGAAVTVESITGWLVRLDPHELSGCLLATHVGGGPLPAANGAPCRLVVPTRRGLDWIKWVGRITAT
ncbi:MAG TPA: molybdopterin-dependent oxidoreductase [Candidatus Limnocylindria bacterium]|nr:molybdopterin-dependent oxidoreductase [Candidatus Limnocylindria bacterium]